MQVAKQVAALAARLEREKADGRELTPKEALVLRLNAQYPADVGVLSAYFLNLVVLEPNQACLQNALTCNTLSAWQPVMACADSLLKARVMTKERQSRNVATCICW